MAERAIKERQFAYANVGSFEWESPSRMQIKSHKPIGSARESVMFQRELQRVWPVEKYQRWETVR